MPQCMESLMRKCDQVVGVTLICPELPGARPPATPEKRFPPVAGDSTMDSTIVFLASGTLALPAWART